MRLKIALLAAPLLAVPLPARRAPAQVAEDPPPGPEERQLPRAMHSRMEELPHVKVSREGADVNGVDQRSLQGAVDYVAGLGGGMVEIGPGEFVLKDSLHLRSHVTVRGVPGKTILRKAPGTVSCLAVDGDFGEEQITVESPRGFEVGMGVAIWDDDAGGFHTTVARITGRTGRRFSIDRPLMADCMVARNARAATVFPVVSGVDIEDNGQQGIRVRGETRGLVFRRKRIRDTRAAGSRTQVIGILIEEKVGDLTLEGNEVEGGVEDRRPGQ